MTQPGVAGSNHTDYSCDPARTTKVGTAEHDDSLRFGSFVFADGERFAFGIR